jgi:hypothetical protein
VLSVIPAALITSDRLGSGNNGNFWMGDVAEMVVFDRALTPAEHRSVEEYLAVRYAVFTPAASTPSISPPWSGGSDPVDVELASGTPDAQIYYTLDGSEPTQASDLYTGPVHLSTPTTLKAKAFKAGWAPSQTAEGSFLSDDLPVPLLIEGLSLWVRADTGVADSGGLVSQWDDQSPNANHLVSPGGVERPQVVTDAQSGRPALRFDGVDDTLHFTTREAGTIRTVFWVLRDDAPAATWARWMTDDPALGTDFNTGSSALWHNSYTSPSILNGETRLNARERRHTEPAIASPGHHLHYRLARSRARTRV